MRAEKSAPERLATAGCNLLHGKPARIGGHYGPGPDDRLDPLEQGAFGVQLLHDSLDHPFHVGQPVEVILEIAGLDTTQRRLIKKRGRFEAGGRFKPPLNDGIPVFPFYGWHIEQKHPQARIGEVRRNLCAHGPGAQYSGLAKREHRHEVERMRPKHGHRLPLNVRA